MTAYCIHSDPQRSAIFLRGDAIHQATFTVGSSLELQKQIGSSMHLALAGF